MTGKPTGTGSARSTALHRAEFIEPKRVLDIL
jgi:hypothetical protein